MVKQISYSEYDELKHKKLTKLSITSDSVNGVFDIQLPPGLIYLNVCCNKITEFKSELPPGLIYLDISCNKIIVFNKKLPKSLKYLDISYNELKQFNCKLSQSLKFLNIGMNKLKQFNHNLPSTIEYLNIHRNRLKLFNVKLPQRLRYFNIGYNEDCVIYMDSIPLDIEYFDISGVFSIYLKNYNLSTTMKYFGFNNTPLKKFKHIPNIKFLDCDDLAVNNKKTIRKKWFYNL